MSSLVCAISGQPPQEPVVARTSGRLFEKRLILKHLDQSPTCPVSNEALTADDLVELKANPAVKPRPVEASSVPSLLNTLQNEWDTLMLETFDLKKNLDTARQELSQALYQYDAACRVIARVTQERDDARAAVEHAEERLRNAPAHASANGTGAMESDGPAGLTDDIKQVIARTGAELLAGRKKRGVPDGTVEGEAFATYKEGGTIKCGRGALNCFHVDPLAAGHAVAGGNNGEVHVINVDSKSSHPHKAHHGAVTDVCVGGDFAVSGGADGAVMVWGKGGQVAAFDDLKSPITGVSLHPSHSYCAGACQAGRWSLYDISSQQSKGSFGDGAGISCSKFHPDGLLLGAGGVGGVVSMWDVKAQSVVLQFAGGAGEAVNRIAFAENGYHIGTVSAGGKAKLWDLRKLAKSGGQAPALAELALGGATDIAFDLSSQYLVASGSDGVRVFQNKTCTELCSLQGHKKGVVGVGFGSLAQCVLDASADGTVKVYSS